MKWHLLLPVCLWLVSPVFAQNEAPGGPRPAVDPSIRDEDRQFLDQWAAPVQKREEGRSERAQPQKREDSRSERAKPRKRDDGQRERAQLRELVTAFVVAGGGSDPEQEAKFYADEVDYYDHGVVSREFIRKEIRDFYERWPSRRYWVAAMIRIVEGDRITELDTVEVRYPLGYIIKGRHEQRIGKGREVLRLRRKGSGWEIISAKAQPID